VVKSLRP